LDEAERLSRVNTTIVNAEHFINLAKKRQVGFTPIGTVQALSPAGYAETVSLYYELGYRHMAIGGLVPLSDDSIEEIVTHVMTTAAQLLPRPWIHLFGIFRPKLQAKFRELKVDSFDSATYFLKVWLRYDQNYLARDLKWNDQPHFPTHTEGKQWQRFG